MTIQVAQRYVEMTFRQPEEETVRFMAVLTVGTPNQALANARAEVYRRHPAALEVEEFMQRKLDETRAEKILAAIQAGTWTGWEFAREGTSA